MSDEQFENDPLDEELVAYLDGELDAGERARVERRLADDAPYRERLRRLQDIGFDDALLIVPFDAPAMLEDLRAILP